MTLIQLTNPGAKPMELCISEAYAALGAGALGGASADGWSKMNDFQRCPYRYWLLHERERTASDGTAETPAALALGALFHAALACHYTQATRDDWPTALALLAKVRAVGGDAAIVDECERLYMAYFNHYKNPHDEQISPVAIEYGAGREGVHTCRFDMLAMWQGKLWNFEHKTAGRESREVLEGWWLDGEIIGQHYAYKLSGMEATFGPLFGTVVNVVIKTQVPKFRRVEVIITDQIIEDYIRDRAYWATLRNTMRETGYWPRKLNGCIGRYGMCEFWDHCRDATSTDDARLNRMLQLSLEGK